MACTVRPSFPVMVRAATRALTIASSVAPTVASNSGPMRSLGSIVDAAPRPLRRAAGGGGREGHEQVARAVAGDAARAREAEGGPAGQPLQLVRQQRRVGGHHDDDGARLAFEYARSSRSSWPTGTPGDAELVAQAEVGLDEHAHRVAAVAPRQHARGGADAALELVADHPGAAADVALGHRPRRARPRWPGSACSAFTCMP